MHSVNPRHTSSENPGFGDSFGAGLWWLSTLATTFSFRQKRKNKPPSGTLAGPGMLFPAPATVRSSSNCGSPRFWWLILQGWEGHLHPPLMESGWNSSWQLAPSAEPKAERLLQTKKNQLFNKSLFSAVKLPRLTVTSFTQARLWWTLRWKNEEMTSPTPTLRTVLKSIPYSVHPFLKTISESESKIWK